MRPPRPANPLLAAGALVLALVVACRPTATPVPNAQSYFPLVLGTRWTYETTFHGPNGGTQDTVVAVCRVRDDPDVGRMFLVSTCAGDALVQGQLLVPNGFEIAEPIAVNRAGEPRPRDPPEVVARTDLRVGQQWRWEGTIGDDERRALFRVANRGRVLTPAGEFEAVRLIVTDYSGGPPAVLERWFAPGVGMVREAGALVLTDQDGRAGMIELVRTLKEHRVMSVDSIPCCARVPGSVGG